MAELERIGSQVKTAVDRAERRALKEFSRLVGGEHEAASPEKVVVDVVIVAPAPAEVARFAAHPDDGMADVAPVREMNAPAVDAADFGEAKVKEPLKRSVPEDGLEVRDRAEATPALAKDSAFESRPAVRPQAKDPETVFRAAVEEVHVKAELWNLFERNMDRIHQAAAEDGAPNAPPDADGREALRLADKAKVHRNSAQSSARAAV